MNNNMKIVISVVCGLVLVLLVALSPFTLINAGHRGVVTSFGKVKDTVLGEGFHFISPVDSVKEYDVRTQKVETQASAASKDLQSVEATIALNFHVNPDTVMSLYQETKGSYETTLIAPAIQEAVKASTAQYTADELITKRSEVKEAMKQALIDRSSMKFFIVDDVSIVNFSFSESFNTAIENKVRAEQDALASKNKLEQTKYEAEQKIVSATAEAESLRIQANALSNNKSLVELEAVRRWNGVLPSYIMGDSVPFLNLK